MVSKLHVKNQIGVVLKPEVRFAVAMHFREQNNGLLIAGGPEVRSLAIDALTSCGWPTLRIKEEYLKYALLCNREGIENEFPGARL